MCAFVYVHIFTDIDRRIYCAAEDKDNVDTIAVSRLTRCGKLNTDNVLLNPEFVFDSYFESYFTISQN